MNGKKSMVSVGMIPEEIQEVESREEEDNNDKEMNYKNIIFNR